MKKLFSYALLASFFAVAPLMAHEGHDDMGDMKDMKGMKGMDMKDMDHKDGGAKAEAKEKTVTLNGEFVELGCYTNHDSTGTEHTDCAEKCARAGAPIALKEAGTGKLYVVITDGHFINPAEPAFGKIGMPVSVQAITKTAGNLDLLIIRKVDLVKTKEAPKSDK